MRTCATDTVDLVHVEVVCGVFFCVDLIRSVFFLFFLVSVSVHHVFFCFCFCFVGC